MFETEIFSLYVYIRVLKKGG